MTHNSLHGISDDPLTPASEGASGMPSGIPSRGSLLDALENEVRNTRQFKPLVRDIAWLCSHCSTINGLIYGKKETRKTCKKCWRVRTSVLTVSELIQELELAEELKQKQVNDNPLDKLTSELLND